MYKKAIDSALIERMASFGGHELKVQLIDMFLDKMPERAALINQGILNKEADSVERTAHSLISSAGNLGGFAVSDLAVELEAAAMQADYPKMSSINQKLIKTVDEFQAFLIQQKTLS